MATYTELFDIAVNNTLLDKMTAAIAIQADVIRQEAGATNNHANRVLWAKQAFSDPRYMATKMIWAVLAANSSATKVQILGATDASLLSAVAAAVDTFANGTTV